jgi:hypothetical protein
LVGGMTQLKNHGDNLRVLADALKDPAERARLSRDYVDNGSDSILGSVIGNMPFYGDVGRAVSRVFGDPDKYFSDKDINSLVNGLNQRANYTDQLTGFLQQRMDTGSLMPEHKALLTGNYSGLSDRQVVSVIDLSQRIGLLSPNSSLEAFKQNTTVGQALGLAENYNPTQNIYATAVAAPMAVLEAYSAARQLNVTLDGLRNAGAQALAQGLDNPFAFEPFRRGTEAAMGLAMRVERSLVHLGENIALKLLGKVPFVSKDYLKSWRSRLNGGMGAEGELAFDMVFRPLADANGRGVFREVTDRFKVGSNNGIDRTIVTNSGNYLDFEIKVSQASKWASSFSPDQKKGAAFFVKDRLERIANDVGNPARAEAQARLDAIRFGEAVKGYAIVGKEVYSRGSKVDFEIRTWDKNVTKSNNTMQTRFGRSI